MPRTAWYYAGYNLAIIIRFLTHRNIAEYKRTFDSYQDNHMPQVMWTNSTHMSNDDLGYLTIAMTIEVADSYVNAFIIAA